MRPSREAQQPEPGCFNQTDGEVAMTALPNDHVWRCDCGDGHFLTLWWWPDDPHDRALTVEGYLGVEGDNSMRLRDRLVRAWRLIRNGHSASGVGLILDEATAADVNRALAEYLADMRRARRLAEVGLDPSPR
jgi:hypothetical protein